ncbi:hypothetical protein FPV67DRAFT_1672869 [Lyophyllum atratum]|nr:hypothetical protein FPV67DRAFT_1672869 [Lyophyllum atratum]
MSDSSFHPSSPATVGDTFNPSSPFFESQHKQVKYEQELEQSHQGKKRRLSHDVGDFSSPCPTPRATATKARAKIEGAYAPGGALDSQTSSQEFIDLLLKPVDKSIHLDASDVDLLRMHCIELAESLDKVCEERDRACFQRDQALNKLEEWEQASVAIVRLSAHVGKQ